MKETKKDSITKRIKSLDSLIEYFENETELDIDKALGKYEEAMKLVHSIKSELSGYELKINEIKIKYENNYFLFLI